MLERWRKSLVRQRWVSVFERGVTSSRAQDELLHGFSHRIDCSTVLPLSIDLVGRIVDKGKHRAPGPDGTGGLGPGQAEASGHARVVEVCCESGSG